MMATARATPTPRPRRCLARPVVAPSLLLLLLALVALCPTRIPALAPAAATEKPPAAPSSPSRPSAPGSAFHAARAALLDEKLGLAGATRRDGSGDADADNADAANPNNPNSNPPLYLSAAGERDRLPDDAHPPAAAIRHPSFNASAPNDPAAAAQRSQFVRRAPAGNGSGGLHLGDGPVPFVAIGLSWPDAVLAAIEEEEEETTTTTPNRRTLLSRLLSRLSASGFNALRVLALPSGAQPWPGALSAKHLDALDWLVAECRAHGLRLLLVLADGSGPLGGGEGGRNHNNQKIPASHARQYTNWVDDAAGTGGMNSSPLTLRDGFFGNDTVKSVFLDAAAAVVGRRNARVDGLAYRHDPTVLGWELLAGAHPGCCCGACGSGKTNDSNNENNNDPAAPLRGWARQVAGFLRKKDPHHLIALGGDGLLGASSPHLAAAHNPLLPLDSEAALCGRACAAARTSKTGRVALAHDWHDVTSSVPDLDLAVAAVAPWRFGGGGDDGGSSSSLIPSPCRRGAWGRGPAAEDDGSGGASLAKEEDEGAKGSSSSEAAWARGWVRAHQRDSLRLQRPLLLTVEVFGGDGGGGGEGREGSGGNAKTNTPFSVLEAVAADLVRAVDERRAPSAGVFVSVVGPGGWRDDQGGGGVAALLRAAVAGEEGETEQGPLLLSRLLGLDHAQEGEAGGGVDGWRRFYHGQEEEGEEGRGGGFSAGRGDGGGGGGGDLDASARDVLRVVGRLGRWQRKREEAAVVVRS